MFPGFDLKTTGKWFAFSTLVGVVAGFGAIAFQFACQLAVGIERYYDVDGATEYVQVQAQ